MSKRTCPFDESEQYIKKQIGNQCKTRGIKSMASEKTLQLLYKGQTKSNHTQNGEKEEVKSVYNCFQCSASIGVQSKCFYCDNFICSNCTNICNKCDEYFCKNCSFPSYGDSTSSCYSCY